MSRKLPLSQKTLSGPQESNQNLVKIICQQKNYSCFSLILSLWSSLSLLAIAALLGVSASTVPALAQTQEQELAQTHQGQDPSQTQVIYVSSSMGNDSGDGSKSFPLRTIARALKLAEPKTVILLAPGTYSAATGEIFPLILKAEVTLQGNPFNSGENVIIEGGGDFVSPTFARQNIAILPNNDSKLTGVTVTNPNYRGYGVWIESSSPIVVKNTLTGNTHDGISVVGSSTPIIEKNNFSDNGANGITIYGTSQGEIRDNVFQKTGFGINIAEDAAPMVVGNRVIYNQDGVLVQGNARPALRGNYIERNQRDGIVAIAGSFPDIGSSGEPGRNTIRNNGRYDINNAVDARKTIPAYGNVLGSDRLHGSIDLAGRIEVPRRPVAIALRRRQEPENLQSSSSPTTATGGIEISVPPPESQSQRSNNSIKEAAERAAEREAEREPETETVASRPRLLDRILPNRRSDRSSGETDSIPGVIRVPVPIPESRRSRPSRQPGLLRSIPDVSSPGLLRVPSSDIPLGSGGYVPPGIGMGPSSFPRDSRSGANSSGNSRALALGLRYRVVVDPRSRRDSYRLRSIVPDAFATTVNGESVMQAGAFRDRAEAYQLLRRLVQNGLNARIVPIR